MSDDNSCRQKKALEKGEYLQGNNAISRLCDLAPLREEKREVLDAPVDMRCNPAKSFKFLLSFT